MESLLAGNTMAALARAIDTGVPRDTTDEDDKFVLGKEQEETVSPCLHLIGELEVASPEQALLLESHPGAFTLLVKLLRAPVSVAVAAEYALSGAANLGAS